MTTTTPKYGASIPLTVTNLHSVADGDFWQSASRNNGTDKAIRVHLFITLVTLASTVSDIGHIKLYVAGSIDGSNFAGNASGSEGSYSATSDGDVLTLRGLAAYDIDATNAAAQTYYVSTILDRVPPYWSLIIENRTGQAFAASGNDVEMIIETVETA